MTGGRQRRKRRLREARQTTAVVTHISSLPDDIVREIFLRLPSLATLVRAACACRAWRRAVSSSLAFRCRFRALHQALLLGVFFDRERGDLPVFAPAKRRSDPDVLAALRGGDFCLTTLMEEVDDKVPLGWRPVDCRDGYLVLVNSATASRNLIDVVNPLARQRPEYIGMPTLDDDTALTADLHLLSSDEDPMSFRLVYLFHDMSRTRASRVRVAVFSSETWDWRVLPWVELEHDDGANQWLQFGTQAKGLVCWGFTEQERMLTLDTKTMKFSVRELPPCPDPEPDDAFFRRLVVAGESKDGALCIVRVAASGIYAWLWLIDDDCGGGDKWVLRNILKYTGVAAILHTTDVVAIRDGFVYLATSDTVLSLCLETWKLEKLFSMGNYCEDFYPYFMAWPCSLVGNYGRFAVLQDQDGPSNDA
ncbi:hypothetical protein C2845_PM07G14850 [Panicum miliaceum]|uniref:F-box domain-containing protein n=1 Tax=Panicum miliaceum TaxID=4540 RepID=A0A3L6SR04_PANMI|nr:hypothetical protein C2845_PM07G14850 [Panicum miliaceum]